MNENKEIQISTENPTTEEILELPNAFLETETPRKYSVAECAFSWVCLIAGYTFCRVFPANSNPLGAFLFMLLLTVFTIAALIIGGAKISMPAYLTAASSVITSLIPLISANGFLSFFAYSYSLIAYCYFVCSATGNTLKGPFSNLILIDYLKALFVLPFSSFGKLFRALFSAKFGGKQTLKVLAGLLIAIFPTAIVTILLSYDSGFSDLFVSIFNFNTISLFSHIGSFILGVPIGMYLFGLFISAIDKSCADTITAEKCEAAAKSVKKLPVITTVSATVPLLFIYSLFFISQWQYYVSGFTNTLPDSFSYAEYAREGFFQLCAVSVINLIVIISVMAFMKRSANKSPTVLKVLCIFYSVFTLILISTAIAKMVMYIDCYGLTQKRIYASFLMIVLACIFVLIIVLQFVPKLKIIPLSLAIAIVLFTALGLANVDKAIAKHNVDRYISGELATVDVGALFDLGDAAVPEMVRLSTHIQDGVKSGKITQEDFNIYSRLKYELEDLSKEYESEKESIFKFNIPKHLAKQALKNYNK